MDDLAQATQSPLDGMKSEARPTFRGLTMKKQGVGLGKHWALCPTLSGQSGYKHAIQGEVGLRGKIHHWPFGNPTSFNFGDTPFKMQNKHWFLITWTPKGDELVMKNGLSEPVGKHELWKYTLSGSGFSQHKPQPNINLTYKWYSNTWLLTWAKKEIEGPGPGLEGWGSPTPSGCGSFAYRKKRFGYEVPCMGKKRVPALLMPRNLICELKRWCFLF